MALPGGGGLAGNGLGLVVVVSRVVAVAIPVMQGCSSLTWQSWREAERNDGAAEAGEQRNVTEVVPWLGVC